jgi:hypothetical protein
MSDMVAVIEEWEVVQSKLTGAAVNFKFTNLQFDQPACVQCTPI